MARRLEPHASLGEALVGEVDEHRSEADVVVARRVGPEADRQLERDELTGRALVGGGGAGGELLEARAGLAPTRDREGPHEHFEGEGGEAGRVVAHGQVGSRGVDAERQHQADGEKEGDRRGVESRVADHASRLAPSVPS